MILSKLIFVALLTTTCLLATSIPRASAAPQKLGDWLECYQNSDCVNSCCMKEFSDGVLKCTPNGCGASSAAPATSTTSAAPAQSTLKLEVSGSSDTVVVESMPAGFEGVNTGIGSWFRTDHPDDSTNGNSWCNYKYSDKTNGFAPDITVMTEGTNVVYPDPRWFTYGRAWCGLEAWVYNPVTGKNLTMYITDAFDHFWVKTPGSIDIVVTPFETLAGFPPVDKNKVMLGVQWQLTGRRSEQYKFGGAGDP